MRGRWRSTGRRLCIGPLTPILQRETISSRSRVGHARWTTTCTSLPPTSGLITCFLKKPRPSTPSVGAPSSLITKARLWGARTTAEGQPMSPELSIAGALGSGQSALSSFSKPAHTDMAGQAFHDVNERRHLLGGMAALVIIGVALLVLVGEKESGERAPPPVAKARTRGKQPAPSSKK